MSKRNAASELNADNWDQDDESEEAGTFKTASSNVLAGRQIKKAKRRGAEGASSTGGSKAFAGFAGFTAMPPEGSKPLSGLFNGTSSQTTTGPTPGIFSKAGSTTTPFSSGSTETKPSSTTETGGIFGNPSSVSTSSKPLTNGHSGSKSPARSKYLHQLKALNESVTKWIKNHVESNPYCILTPIFKDYEKHLEEITKKFPEESKDSEKAEVKKDDGDKKKDEKEEEQQASSSSSSSEKSDEESSEKPAAPATTSGFSFAKLAGSTSQDTAPSTSGFKFGSGTLGSSTGSAFGGFSSLGGSTAGTSGFSFAVSKPSAASTEGAQGGEGEEEEYVPPKPESSQVTEEDATYTKKCKLFYKKEGNWAEKGIGNLFLKPCGEKTQLLIRADTTLGNILLNIMLTNSIPLSRQGKNNVALFCIPNPPIEEKKDGEGDDKTPVGMLIKVKTAEDADELLEKLTDAKR